MKQYNQIKAKYPDALLLFRVGDFYETFGSDAIKASKILGIIQTKRGAGSSSEIELAGFPHHSLNTYLPKLVKAGCRVAICDQLEDPKMTKTIVKRGVTELVTPGVALNDDVLEQKKNNYLAAVHPGKKNWGVSFLDISTGDFLTSEGSVDHIDQLLQKFNPSEVLISKPKKNYFTEHFGTQQAAFYMEDWVFQKEFCTELLTQHFQTKTLKGFGVDGLEAGTITAGVILHYLSETQHKQLQHIHAIQAISSEDYVGIDRFTARNLELLYPNSREGVSLIDVIDFTSTAMGGRMLRQWVSFPLKSIKKIQERHQAIKGFMNQEQVREEAVLRLKNIGDIERLMSKIATQKVAPRELIQLKNSLVELIPLKKHLSDSTDSKLQNLGFGLHNCDELIETLTSTLKEEAPVSTTKGDFIADGFSEELDELRNLRKSGKDHLDKMVEQETERTGISSLKIAFNNVFGYYIEVRNTHKDKVPEEWIRKQTLVNAERYITEELKEYESKILGAQDRIQSLELGFYAELINKIQNTLGVLKQNAIQIATIDCLVGFTLLAQKQNYNCPKLTEGNSLDIKEGRHPVIENQLAVGEKYITNNVSLNREEQQVIMITGPNMSGKSALLRQTALIVILAQMGSFVPADEVNMGIVDKIFTRVGASDNISLGESTFMVEMNESAAILNNITDSSLVLLDEIGRGTSTYDGISIAWAIAEYLHQHPAKPKTLFATHYHELNEMTQTFERIKNFNVSVKELKDSVLFLRKLTPGGSAHSFGIHVAKMAGMPKTVLATAERKLKFLEKSHQEEDRKEALKNSTQDMQLSFINLDDPLLEALREEIKNLDIDTLTPVEALMKLNDIKRRLKG
ncbi:DNA mismatch repair protein MutS [Candidatus Arcticimaribacter forsetii]|uniref:DNA mismatch repair protein MutS n=1 Tax=Candidatus Arcticimaribacter forsetii TaxID=2820661 RepID=UPI00207730D8|nr:DNA mismatch repair protein MutS [Candidatus Arcticimaribacter forsetii]MDB4717019.1 DNA mismatch repair protein MutS [Flavobacteriaceae bacterium]MDB4738300.1 DNA mismatch repair protein MutS [Flavobacteriaceae bacterium]